MLTYPPSVPPALQARINYTIEREDDAFAAAQPIDLVVTGYDGGVNSQHANAARDQAALKSLLNVADVILHELSRVALRARWSPDELRTRVEDLIDQNIVRVYREQHSEAITLDAFTTKVWETIHGRASWAELLRTLSALEPASDASRDAPPHDERPPLSIRKAAKALDCSVDTLYRAIDAGTIPTIPVGKRKKIPAAVIDRTRVSPQWEWRHPPKSPRNRRK
jgi:excisionase family DNA binding protein